MASTRSSISPVSTNICAWRSRNSHGARVCATLRLRAHSTKLYHLGIRGNVARITLANANATRDWRIYCDFAQHLIGIARRLYAEEPLGIELKDTVYALDSTTIDLCLSVFSWTPFRSTKAAVKLHTLLDLRGSIPSFIFISDGKFHDVNVLDHLVPEPGAFYVMDRAYIDFERLARLNDAGSFFVTRAKSNFKAQRRYSHAVDRATGLVCDQTVMLTGFYSRKGFEAPLRRIKFNDPKPVSGSYSSRTTLHYPHLRSPSCTDYFGVWSCFSNGSNSTFASRCSSAQPRTQ